MPEKQEQIETRARETALKTLWRNGQSSTQDIDGESYQVLQDGGEILLIPRSSHPDRYGVRSGTVAGSDTPFASHDYREGGPSYRKAVERCHALKNRSFRVDEWLFCPDCGAVFEVEDAPNSCPECAAGSAEKHESSLQRLLLPYIPNKLSIVE